MVEAMKPSQEWIKVGDPDAEGKIYVEVLACNDLPNLDLPSILNLNNLTDAFCCLIMEDNVVNTSYISNSLNPRWMPSGDNRAFVFGVKHPSSHLYVGIFNHNSTDAIYKPFNIFQEWIHTPVGRVLINLTQLHPDTLYTLHYNIYEVSDESAKDRMAGKHNGTLIIRLRIEWDQQILAAMKLPPPYFISVPRKHDFQTATYTTVGEVSISRGSLVCKSMRPLTTRWMNLISR
jgi:C2 domain